VSVYNNTFAPPYVEPFVAPFEDPTDPTPPASGDPFYNSVSVLLQSQGPNGGTSFLDTGPDALTISGFNGLAHSNLESMFGDFSIKGDGINDYASFPTSSKFDVTSGDHTIEFFFNPQSLVATQRLFSMWTSDASFQWMISFEGANGIRMTSYNGSLVVHQVQGSTAGWSIGTWYHVALVRFGNVFSLYRNNVLILTQTTAASLTGGLATINLFRWPGGGGTNYLNAYMDQFRFTKGVARYESAGFTVPTSPFPTSL